MKHCLTVLALSCKDVNGQEHIITLTNHHYRSACCVAVLLLQLYKTPAVYCRLEHIGVPATLDNRIASHSSTRSGSSKADSNMASRKRKLGLASPLTKTKQSTLVSCVGDLQDTNTKKRKTTAANNATKRKTTTTTTNKKKKTNSKTTAKTRTMSLLKDKENAEFHLSCDGTNDETRSDCDDEDIYKVTHGNYLPARGMHGATTTTLMPSTNSTNRCPIRGLYNPGNMCYLNACIQVLCTVRGFISQLKERGRGELASSVLSVSQKLIDKTDSKTAVDPKHVMEALGDRFADFQQEDAHDCFLALLDNIHEDEKTESGGTDANGSGDVPMTSDKTSQPDIFNFTMQVGNTCNSCGHCW
jgi:hypothetical protein